MKRLNLKAEQLGETTPRNPRLSVVGSGANAYLWIGSDDGFVGVAQNSPKLRNFLKRALARMEKAANRRNSQ